MLVFGLIRTTAKSESGRSAGPGDHLYVRAAVAFTESIWIRCHRYVPWHDL